MNSGVEAGETAVKLIRKWAYLNKKVPEYVAQCKHLDTNILILWLMFFFLSFFLLLLLRRRGSISCDVSMVDASIYW
jgi:hypothetical protein